MLVEIDFVLLKLLCMLKNMKSVLGPDMRRSGQRLRRG